MALITCPECGAQISDKAPACIHCGCPIEPKGPEINLYDMVFVSLENNSSKYPIKTMLETSYNYPRGVSYAHLEQPGSVLVRGIKAENVDCVKFKFSNVGCVVDFVPSNEQSPNPLNSTWDKWREKATAPIKCPQCGSTQVVTGARGVNWTVGFIGASKTVNRCAKCGYKWYPGKE